MRGITDIHSHIIFGVDDGARSLDESMEILKQEYAQGVRNVIFTPHFHMGKCTPNPNKIKSNFEKIKSKIKDEEPDMNVYLGNEILACNDMAELLDNGELFTLAQSKYVLVEFETFIDYSSLKKQIGMLLNGGYMPIVAHCERYRCLRKSLNRANVKNIKHLVEMGAYMQVNTTTVFKSDRRFVKTLIDNDILHFIATDTHNLRNRSVYWDKCVRYLEKKYNKDFIKSLLVENPSKILTGEYI